METSLKIDCLYAHFIEEIKDIIAGNSANKGFIRVRSL